MRLTFNAENGKNNKRAVRRELAAAKKARQQREFERDNDALTPEEVRVHLYKRDFLEQSGGLRLSRGMLPGVEKRNAMENVQAKEFRREALAS